MIPKNRIMPILKSFYNSDYYVENNIPENKLRNAREKYFYGQNDIPMALIDATIFGSAKDGMVIGLKGVYFGNDWATHTERNFLSWDDLSSIYLEKKEHGVLLYHYCEFSLAGSNVTPGELLSLINKILKEYKEIKAEKIKNLRLEEQNLIQYFYSGINSIFIEYSLEFKPFKNKIIFSQLEEIMEEMRHRNLSSEWFLDKINSGFKNEKAASLRQDIAHLQEELLSLRRAREAVAAIKHEAS